MIRRYLALMAALAALRLAGRLALMAGAVLLVVAAAPVSLVAALAVTLAWLRGWPPWRLYRAALACLPMVAAWLVAVAVSSRSASQLAAAPYDAWLAAWHQAAAGSAALAATTIAPAAIPLGLAVGGLAWSRRIYAMETGTGGIFPTSPAAFQARQWRRQVRTARARIAAPGSVPLLSRNGAVVAGAVIRAAGHPVRDLMLIPYPRLRSHQVIVGTTGTGKTTLLLRLWAGFLARGLQLHAAGAGQRPLLVVLDCKGGADSRRIADRVRRVLRDAGARSTAIWPDEASLSLWELPPAQLTSTLLDMIEHGTGAAAYYADVMETIVALVVGAPGGPPASAADFLARLDAGWLGLAYAGPGHGAEAALLRSASRHVTDIALRFRTLFRRLGAGLDGPGGYGDADAWYCILEGTADMAVAEAQARALVDLLAQHAAHGAGARREILLAVDEFSAVSRRLPIWQLYERARSLGLAVQVSAQSWPGLAPDEDDRYRLAATADGGIWLLRTPHPEPVTALAGKRPVLDTSRRLLGVPRWAHEGSSRIREEPVADPALIRRLGVGQAAYIYRGGVTFVQVKRLVAAPAALNERTTAGRALGPAGAEPAAARTAPLGPARWAGTGRPARHGRARCGRRRSAAGRGLRHRTRLNPPLSGGLLWPPGPGLPGLLWPDWHDLRYTGRNRAHGAQTRHDRTGRTFRGGPNHGCAAVAGTAPPVGSGTDRAVRVTRPPRRRGDGPGVPGPVHRGPAGGRQDDQDRVRRGSRVPGPVRPRGGRGTAGQRGVHRGRRGGRRRRRLAVAGHRLCPRALADPAGANVRPAAGGGHPVAGCRVRRGAGVDPRRRAGAP